MKKPWFARVVRILKDDGVIISKKKYKTKAEARAYQNGFARACELNKETIEASDFDMLEDYFVDVTQNTKLIDR